MYLRRMIYKLLVYVSTNLIGHRVWKVEASNNGLASSKNFSASNLKKANALFDKSFKGQANSYTIELKNISKTYENGFLAVKDFNLTIKSQEFVALLGPSGCGKTTLLRMVAGLETITRGDYVANGVSLSAQDPAERNTSMVFQNYALYPFMTVYKNVAFGLKLKTYNNPTFNAALERYLLVKNPEFKTVMALKNHIYDLKHPLQAAINDVKVARKKAQKRGDRDQAKLMEQKLRQLMEQRRQQIAKAAEQISAAKAEIQTTKNQAQQLANKAQATLRLNRQTYAKKVRQWDADSNTYYQTKKTLIPTKNAKVKTIKVEQKKILREQKQFVKKALKNMKKHDGKQTAKKALATFHRAMATFDQRLEQNDEKIAEIKYEIGVIKDKNSVLKQEAKTQILATTTWKDLIKIAVLWKRTIPYRIVQLAQTVGLENYLNRKPTELSGGQRQRVALMRAISKDSKLFLFDEPLSNLDAKLRSRMRLEIRKIHDLTKSTSLYVTHDQIEAMTMADKVVVMNNGFIQQIDTPNNLYQNPANVFVAKFIGTPMINIVSAKLSNGALVTASRHKISLSKQHQKNLLKQKSQQVLIGIRPNKLKINHNQTKDSVAGIVTNIELIGSEIIATVNVAQLGVMQVISSQTTKYKIHDQVFLSFNVDNLHIFDAKTGYALTSKCNEATLAARKIWEINSHERFLNRKIINDEKNQATATQKTWKLVKKTLSNQQKINDYKRQVENYEANNQADSLLS